MTEKEGRPLFSLTVGRRDAKRIPVDPACSTDGFNWCAACQSTRKSSNRLRFVHFAQY